MMMTSVAAKSHVVHPLWRHHYNHPCHQHHCSHSPRLQLTPLLVLMNWQAADSVHAHAGWCRWRRSAPSSQPSLWQWYDWLWMRVQRNQVAQPGQCPSSAASTSNYPTHTHTHGSSCSCTWDKQVRLDSTFWDTDGMVSYIFYVRKGQNFSWSICLSSHLSTHIYVNMEVFTRPTSRKPLQLADDILRLASRLPPASRGLRLTPESADKLLSKVTFETCRRRLKTFFSNC